MPAEQESTENTVREFFATFGSNSIQDKDRS